MDPSSPLNDPVLNSKVREYVETLGLSSEELLNQLQNEAIQQLMEAEEGKNEEVIPSEIRIISQALAYRSATIDDIDEIFALLSQAYQEELYGGEAFRKDAAAVSKDSIIQYIEDPSYEWTLLEAPNGQGYEKDGVLLGACCYSTDGVSRKNGVVEGQVGSIRYLGVLTRYRGLCLGRRLLKRVEEIMLQQRKCCRAMCSIPTSRTSLLKWIEERNYHCVRSIPYPFHGLNHTPLNETVQETMELTLWVKPLQQQPPSDSQPKFREIDADMNTTTNTTTTTTTTTATTATATVVSSLPPPPPGQQKGKMVLPPHWRMASLSASTVMMEEPESVLDETADGKGATTSIEAGKNKDEFGVD